MHKKSLHTIPLIGLSVLTICASDLCSLHTEKRRQQLARYHDSGKYYQEISATIKEAIYYLKFRLTQNQRMIARQKLAIVMDIDETALSNYQQLAKLNFHVSAQQRHSISAQSHATVIPYTLALYNYAKDHGIAIFFITGREKSVALQTIINLQHAGYQHWAGLLFSTKADAMNSPVYNRKQLRKMLVHRGYDIVANIGNRYNTLAGGYSDMVFKLPNPFY